MEKDIGKIEKNPETDIIVRIDDFGGKMGLTIREFVTSERYTGFTKAGVRITVDNFEKFKEMINSVKSEDLKGSSTASQERLPEGKTGEVKAQEQKEESKKIEDDPDIDEDSLL